MGEGLNGPVLSVIITERVGFFVLFIIQIRSKKNSVNSTMLPRVSGFQRTQR